MADNSKNTVVRCQYLTDSRFKKQCEPGICDWKLCEKRPEGGYLSKFKGDQYAIVTFLGAIKCPCCGNWTDIPPSPVMGVEKVEAKNATSRN